MITQKTIINFLDFDKGRMNRQVYFASICALHIFESFAIEEYSLSMLNTALFIIISYLSALFMTRRLHDFNMGGPAYFPGFFALHLLPYLFYSYVGADNMEKGVDAMAQDIAQMPIAALTLNIFTLFIFVLYLWLLFYPGTRANNNYGPMQKDYIGPVLEKMGIKNPNASAKKSSKENARYDTERESINNQSRIDARKAQEEKLKQET